MEHHKQVEILRELIRQKDAGENVDAGIMYKNPTSSYTCPDLAAREWEIMFRDHPQLIGLTSDLPGPGHFMTCDDFGTPVLATRDSEGRFRAFLNICRHRGARLADEARGQTHRFLCPFHNWAYSTDGKLTGIPQAKHFGPVDRSCRGLIELPCEEKYGLLFVHPKPDGQLDVDTLLGELVPEISQWQFNEGIVYQAETIIDKPLNWKLANDTFGETYHFGKLHKETLGQVFHSDVLHYETFGRNHRFVIATMGLDLMRQLPESDWNILHGANPLYYIYPNVQFNIGESQLDMIKIYPHPRDPGRSITRISHYATEAGLEAARLLDPAENSANPEKVYDAAWYSEMADGPIPFVIEEAREAFISTIEQQDYLMGEHQQIAAESGTLDHVLFGRNEPALHHYHQTFREALGLTPLEEFSSPPSA